MNDMDSLHFQWLKQVQRPLMDLQLQWLQLCVIRSVLTIVVSHMVLTIPRVIWNTTYSLTLAHHTIICELVQLYHNHETYFFLMESPT